MIELWWYILLVEDHGYLVSFEELMMCTLSSLMVWCLGWFSWLEDGIFHHDAMNSLDIWFSGSLWQWWGDSSGLLLGLVYIFLVWRGWILWYHGWISTMVEWEFLALIYLLSVCRCWRFLLDPVIAEVPLTFAWYTWFFMVCGDVFSSWCMEMVASWGLMGFLVKVWFILLSLVWGWFHFYVMVYSWYAFRVVTCYSMFVWSMLSLLRWLYHVVIFMFLRPWLELWHWS